MDAQSFHQGCAVLAGEKWVANYFVEVAPPFCEQCLLASERAWHTG